MNPLSPWPIVIVLSLALATAAGLTRWLVPPPVTGRFDTLDGLRGFLAFGVFLHHGAVWYFYLRTGSWDAPASTLYVNLGQDSVGLFFMITGFLFWTKLLDGGGKRFDWIRLYVSRVLRLTPLYVFTMAAGALLLGASQHFLLVEPGRRLAVEALRWLSFTILGTPPVNGSEESFIVIAGVTWTLPYEWLFYCALPLAAPFLRVRASWLLTAGSLLVTAALVHYVKPQLPYLAAFGGGILAAHLVRRPGFVAHARRWYATVLALAALGTALCLCPALRSPPALPLLAVAFALIAAGNPLGGILHWPASRLVGEITYSVYLLHGLVLFALFRLVIGRERAATFSPSEHWLLVYACVPLLVVLCGLTFRGIEAPALRQTPAVGAWLRARGASPRPGG